MPIFGIPRLLILLLRRRPSTRIADQSHCAALALRCAIAIVLHLLDLPLSRGRLRLCGSPERLSRPHAVSVDVRRIDPLHCSFVPNFGYQISTPQFTPNYGDQNRDIERRKKVSDFNDTTVRWRRFNIPKVGNGGDEESLCKSIRSNK